MSFSADEQSIPDRMWDRERHLNLTNFSSIDTFIFQSANTLSALNEESRRCEKYHAHLQDFLLDLPELIQPVMEGLSSQILYEGSCSRANA